MESIGGNRLECFGLVHGNVDNELVHLVVVGEDIGFVVCNISVYILVHNHFVLVGQMDKKKVDSLRPIRLRNTWYSLLDVVGIEYVVEIVVMMVS